MTYRAIGIMSGSSLDGVDMVCAELVDQSGNWSFDIIASDCLPYSPDWKYRLQNAIHLDARSYQLLHAEYGHYLGKQVNAFIGRNQLAYKVGLISSHGHTTFHIPSSLMTAQLGDGAAIAAETQLPVVTDLRAVDVAFGGQGAPIVPIGEKLLFKEFSMFLNLGGIANISFNLPDQYIAFDVCPANRVLNLAAAELGMEYDEGGKVASSGSVNAEVLSELSAFSYYRDAYPKSLANSFGTDEIYPALQGLTPADKLRTQVEHIAIEIRNSVRQVAEKEKPESSPRRMMVTGGGALNGFLVSRLTELLAGENVAVVVPDEQIVNYKEALVMAFIGVLRWRNEYNVLASVTGASRNSIGGAVWIGQEA